MAHVWHFSFLVHQVMAKSAVFICSRKRADVLAPPAIARPHLVCLIESWVEFSFWWCLQFSLLVSVLITGKARCCLSTLQYSHAARKSRHPSRPEAEHHGASQSCGEESLQLAAATSAADLGPAELESSNAGDSKRRGIGMNLP